MGSKRSMLGNGLGEIVDKEARHSLRFADLFSGSAAVVAHVAARHNVPVYASDLQAFAVVLANAVVLRTAPFDPEPVWADWQGQAARLRGPQPPGKEGARAARQVKEAREWCAAQAGPITRAYGGHYFSPAQAAWLDALRATVPAAEPQRSAALASLIRAASACAASPGHTAQPFQPTAGATEFLREAWQRDLLLRCRSALAEIAGRSALARGSAKLADANQAAAELGPGDLAFIDPPYSGVHYSRFYHVLETIARGGCSDVAGAGRYPPPGERPWSRYSVKSESAAALEELLRTVKGSGASAILTFPQRACSNGLSGAAISAAARRHFAVESHWVKSRFSTMGGNNRHRDARHDARELILVLRPKPAVAISAKPG